MVENINDPTLKAIVNWRNHPCILAVASGYENRETFFKIFFLKKDVSAVLMSQRPFRIIIFQLKLLGKMKTGLQNRFVIISTSH